MIRLMAAGLQPYLVLDISWLCLLQQTCIINSAAQSKGDKGLQGTTSAACNAADGHNGSANQCISICFMTAIVVTC